MTDKSMHTQQPPTSKDEQIGFHKGALATLIGERSELVRLIQITDALAQSHVRALEQLGIKLDMNNRGSENSPAPKK